LSGSGAISLKSLQCCDEQFVWLTFVTCGYHAALPVKGHIMHFTGSGFVEHETKKTDEMTKKLIFETHSLSVSISTRDTILRLVAYSPCQNMP